MNSIQQNDPPVWAAIQAEIDRQRDGLEMIASENYTSPAIMEAAGSVLTNKYAEGYPGRRYYGGCEHVDVVEELARDRARKLFGADFANVQPHSGSQANMAVYLSVLEPGDTVLGLDLAHGGHLTHGMKLNISGQLYNFISYGVTPDTHRIDFEQVASLAREHKPKLIVAGASAYPREIPHDRFAEIAEDVGARLFVDMAHYAGLVAAGLHHNPVPVADFVTTTTHKTLRGPRSGLRYYDESGRTWERQEMVKARPVAGDQELGFEFVQADVRHLCAHVVSPGWQLIFVSFTGHVYNASHHGPWSLHPGRI